jgi:mRNA interferase HigB
MGPLRAGCKVVGRSNWKSIADVKAVCPHANAVGKCTIFNMGGNDFRLVAQVDFANDIVHTKRVMTHAEYSFKDGARWKKACGC